MAPERIVAITQRVIEVPAYGEVRDSLDQAWATWLVSCGFTPVPVPNRVEDAGAFLDSMRVAGVILTGGNNLTLDVYEEDEPVTDAFKTRDTTELAILDHCAENELPVIGFCRGMQMLQAHGGGRLSRVGNGATGHVATFHPISLLSEEWVAITGSATIEVNSFHDYGFTVEQTAPDWEILAVSPEDGVVEAFAHRTLPFLGIGWHPERPNRVPEFDRQLLEIHFDGPRDETPSDR